MNVKFLYSEKLFIILISVAAIALNAFPYVYQHRVTPPDKVYVGSYPIVYDKPTYLAEMAQGEAGNWKMLNMYTTEPQKPVFLYPLYLGLGHVARISHISVENIFLISRFFFGIILLAVVLYFIRYFIQSENQRKVAYLLALFASGIGWIFPDIQSLDLGAIPEAVPLVRFSYFPHFSVSYFLFLGAILFFYHSFKAKNGLFFAALAGILSFILSFVIPFTTLFLLFLAASLLIIIFIKDRISFKNNIKNALVFFAISLPSLFYMYHLGTSDPIWAMVEKQNILPTPPLARVVTGYGLILFFSLLGLWALVKKNRFNGLFFSVWILGALTLSYIPLWIYPMQRRFLETALYIPLAITASFGIKEIYDYLKNKNIKLLRLKFIYAFAVFAMPIMFGSTIQNWQIFHYTINDPNWPKYYLPKENIEAMEWLRQNTPSDSIILASFQDSNNIPYFAARMVYVGHGPMTIDFLDKLKITEDFYSDKYPPDGAFRFLKNAGINYVFYSEQEKKSEDGKQLPYFNPEEYSFLKKIYQNKKAIIYKFE